MTDETAVQKPVFLVGAERSGTTLLRLFLDYHPEIAFQMEFEYAVDLLGDDGAEPSMGDYHRWLRDNFVFQATDFVIDEGLDYKGLLNSFLLQKKKDKPYVGATVHRHYARLLHIWPDARFIYLLRDGRDVARSCIGMGWAGNVYTGATEWIEAVHQWEALKAQLSPDRYIETRYESLVENSEKELRRICEWFGVEFSEHMYDYAETTKYRPPDPKLAHQWKRKLSQEELQLVEARIGDLLESYGYELSGLPRITVSPSKQAELRRQDQLARFKFRLSRYGWALTLSESVSRRLHLAGLHRHAKQRMYALDHKRFA